MATTKGIAVCIGLNAVDPKHYQGWSGNLAACEADAGDMADIARSAGFAKPDTYLTKAATREKVRGAVTRAATAANAGDMVLLTYSGHGGQLPDRNGDEPDGKDETWCLYDGELVDDELLELFTKFRPGVRILVLSDSCHSGTITREVRCGPQVGHDARRRTWRVSRGRPTGAALSRDGRRGGPGDVSCESHHVRPPADEDALGEMGQPGVGHGQRMRRKHARSSSTKSDGCSNAAKCPPRSSSFQYTMFL
jgi:hypothetical protein